MADGTTLQVTGKVVSRAQVVKMIASLGLRLDPTEIHQVTINRTEIVVEKPMRRNPDGFLEARIVTIPVVG